MFFEIKTIKIVFENFATCYEEINKLLLKCAKHMDSEFWPQVNLEEVSLLEDIHLKFLRKEKIDLSWKHFFEGYQLGCSEGHSEENDQERTINKLKFIKNIYRLYGYLEGNFSPFSNHGSCSFLDKKLEKLQFSDDEQVNSLHLYEEEFVSYSQFIEKLRKLYCDSLCIEVLNCSEELREDVWNFIENTKKKPLSVEDRYEIFENLIQASLFEEFIQVKFTGKKRFSLEGAESLIPMLNHLIKEGSRHNINNFCIASTHRGRLNIMANILKKPVHEILMEFQDDISSWKLDTIGDVIYHLGYSNKYEMEGKEVAITVLPNPSHLESIDPVLSGVVKAKQVSEDNDLSSLAVCIHGDAAVSGQGVVYETMQMYNLEGYKVQGTIHLIINNYIGFTANLKQTRSSRFSSDIGKMFSFPIIHVNGDDVEACCSAVKLAVYLRNKYRCDVIIELCCYRKYGHNETDNPLFTQPMEYQIIRRKTQIKDIYKSYLISSDLGVLQKLEDIEHKIRDHLHDCFMKFENKESYKNKLPCLSCEFLESGGLFFKPDTQLSEDVISRLGEKLCFVPYGFNLHKTIQGILEKRLRMIKGELAFDWATAEQLMFASLLIEGTDIRMSGQDIIRGTFSQRHLIWYDQEVGDAYSPFYHLSENQGKARFYNSSVSEFSILGFEFGYSLENAKNLVIWEAQFGDFVNGAQIILDQYIYAAIQKWDIHANLVILLPHGLEGQGPEHSSARMERFLQNASGINFYITSPSTPAQYFHLLRYHVKKLAALPLVVFTHKGLLRNHHCSSPLRDFTSENFKEFLEDEEPNRDAAVLVLCQGRIYYEFLEYKGRFDNEISYACIRIEQLFPFNYEKFLALLHNYKKIKKIVWLQEEPSNMGAYEYIFMTLKDVLDTPLEYAGRKRSSSPSTGSFSLYKQELDEIMKNLFSLDKEV